ncbi:FAD-dependent oxidoreductase [Canibacter oris]|uniref:NADPH-dependent 2,4-dienoyl-CoA reductase/sulfur reductase-like enzyme/rhodanese-related sulfurtransferase n=1 Tax=Canibacter oris TaxID=1365628 RepID=A0A840DMW5_9MICO|nr:FAD-dependent oxidoreductase [Canibacter oris]MBB4071387.1 NADPH-dependent 2,4-dienoyl-CoA reductase/sulfur reductase-like enzyme/rhodanese-related sulfurtransferase [Canibacter oris]
MTTTIIVGGVAGGMSTAARLRRRDEDMEIIVFEASGYVSFANCGLPYYVGGDITERDSLLLQTPESLRARFNIDVRVNHTVTAIDTAAQTVTVQHGGQTSTHHYDHLVLSPGAKPRLPEIPGKEMLVTLRTVEDVDAIVARLTPQVRRAVIIGGGFIGVEMAENLVQRGLEVELVVRGQQILTQADAEIAGVMMQHLRQHGVRITTQAEVTAVTDAAVKLADGRSLPADLVIAATGVVPHTELAAAAGIELGLGGAIKVDEKMRTSAANVYALGDATQKTDFVSDEAALIPLAQTANRHGRLVADIITGRDTKALATQGTAIIGAFGMALASTGWSERQARAAGREIRVVHTHSLSHAGYYPGAHQVHLKLVVDAATDAILGAQAVGMDGVDKRIDVIATAMRAGLTASDLADLELAYAPQFGSAKDAVNITGMVADNQAQGEQMVQWHELAGYTGQLIDVRSPGEHAAGTIPGAVSMPVDTLREILAVDPGAVADGAIVFCQVGLRGHVATTLLREHGIRVRNLSGGYLTWSHAQHAASAEPAAADAAAAEPEEA